MDDDDKAYQYTLFDEPDKQEHGESAGENMVVFFWIALAGLMCIIALLPLP